MNRFIEFTLIRNFIYDEDGDIIGEENFTVPTIWLYDIYKKYFSDKYSSFGIFLDNYIVEEDGEFIYNKAVAENEILNFA